MNKNRFVFAGLLAVATLLVTSGYAGPSNTTTRAESPRPAASKGNNPMHLTIVLQPAHTSIFTKRQTIYLNVTPPPPRAKCSHGHGTISLTGPDELKTQHPGSPQSDLDYYVCH